MIVIFKPAIDNYCVKMQIKKVMQKPSRQPVLVFGKAEGSLEMLQKQAVKRNSEVDVRADVQQKKQKKNDDVVVVPGLPPVADDDDGGMPGGVEAQVVVPNAENRIVGDAEGKVDWVPKVGESVWIRVVPHEEDDEGAGVVIQPASVEEEGCVFWGGVRVESQEQANGYITVHEVNEPQIVEYIVRSDLCVPYRVSDREGHIFCLSDNMYIIFMLCFLLICYYIAEKNVSVIPEGSSVFSSWRYNGNDGFTSVLYEGTVAKEWKNDAKDVVQVKFKKCIKGRLPFSFAVCLTFSALFTVFQMEFNHFIKRKKFLEIP